MKYLSKILLLAALMGAASVSEAQDKPQAPKARKKANKAKEQWTPTPPNYPGGEQAMYQFLASNLQYPEAAKAAKTQGVVYVGMLINEKGEVSDVATTKGIGYGCDQEAERVVQLLKFNPALDKNGNPMTLRFILPVKFVL